MIDWFTVVAQIVNFLILVGLLKYFLYGRITDAMKNREQQISDRWDEADQQRAEASTLLAKAHDTKQRIDNDREALMAQARESVEEHRREWIADVRSDVAKMQARWTDSIQEEQAAFLRDLRRRTGEQVCDIAKRTLADLADMELERQIVAKFIAQLSGLTRTERETLIASIPENVATIQTSGPLAADLQDELIEALKRLLNADLQIQFQQSSDLICGIALKTDSQKLAWDLQDYLSSLEQNVQQTLEDELKLLKTGLNQ